MRNKGYLKMGLFDAFKKKNNAASNADTAEPAASGKVFEDYFTEIQADMIDICLEYIEDYADMIYIYCSTERNTLSADFFYRINGKCIEKEKVNEAEGPHPHYTSDLDNIFKVIEILVEDLEKLKSVCGKYSKPVPTEIKLYYDVKKRSLDGKYKYEAVYSMYKDKLSDDVFEEWFNEESAK